MGFGRRPYRRIVLASIRIAATIGLLLLLIGAVIAHRRVNDPLKAMLLAIVCFVASAFVLVGHISLLAA